MKQKRSRERKTWHMGSSQQTTLNKTTSGKIETLHPCLHDLQYTGQCFTFYMDVWQKRK